MTILRLLFLSVGLALATLPAQAQLSVDLQLKRHKFVRYEPILATVTLTNLSGRTLQLQDADSQWFGFQITTDVGQRLVPPLDPNYHLDPLELKAGETVKRTVNLNALFSLSEYGHYQIKAAIFVAGMGKYYTSKATAIDIGDGTVIWKQVAGVPDGLPDAGSTRTMTALSFQDTNKVDLYIRIEDREMSRVFCTHKLGRLVEGHPPQMQLDSANNLYVLQMVTPKSYLLSLINVSGALLAQSNYTAPKAAPFFRRLPTGEVQIVNARREVAPGPETVSTPNLSDRPPGLPAPAKADPR